MRALTANELREQLITLAKWQEFWTDSERQRYNELNSQYDSLATGEQRGNLSYTDRGNGNPVTNPRGIGLDEGRPRGQRSREGSVTDRALSAWMRNAMGVAVSDDEAQACHDYGLQLNAHCFSARFDPCSRPTRGGPLFYSETESRGTNIKGTSNLGGYSVPTGFFATLERAMLAYAGLLDACEVIRTDTGIDMPWPTSDDTGNSGEMLAEVGAVSEQTVPFAAKTFKSYKCSSKMIRVSSELLRDNAVNLASQFGAIMGERIGRKMNEKCTTGTGTGEPEGIVTGATSGKTAASATAITMDEILDLIHSVDPAYRSLAQGCGFMAHDSILTYLRKLKDSNGAYLWQPSTIVGQPSTLMGWPVFGNQNMASAVTTGQKTILFGAFSKFKVRLVANIRIYRLVELYRGTDEDGFISFMEFDSHMLDAGQHPVKYLVQA